jgi:hypothetical protein
MGNIQLLKHLLGHGREGGLNSKSNGKPLMDFKQENG